MVAEELTAHDAIQFPARNQRIAPRQHTANGPVGNEPENKRTAALGVPSAIKSTCHNTIPGVVPGKVPVMVPEITNWCFRRTCLCFQLFLS